MLATIAEQSTFRYVPPRLYAKQRESIFSPARYVVIEASTKSGKTYGCMVWLFEKALQGKAGQNFWWVAPIYSQAKIAFRRFKTTLPQGLANVNESELTITLPNGAMMWFKGGDKPDSLYGEDVQAAVIDEASRCKEDAWHAVRSTLTATRGMLRIIGNVKGRRNWAYRMARKAELGESDMAFAKITALDAVTAGVLDAAEVEDARRLLPENVFKELYLAEASDDDGNPFGISAIRNCFAPLSPEPPVAFGIDLAKSVDWTVIIGLDRFAHVCRFERFQQPWEETLRDIRRVVGSVPACVDSTGVGDPIVEALQRGASNYIGYKYTATTKQQLMEGLAVAIQQRQVAYPEGVISIELEAFEYVYTRTGVRYSAPEGMHDDCVNALALAVVANSLPKVTVTDEEKRLAESFGQFRGR